MVEVRPEQEDAERREPLMEVENLEVAPKKDPFKSFESIRNEYIFFMLFVWSFAYLATNTFTIFWPEAPTPTRELVEIPTCSCIVHYVDFDGKPGSKRIDYSAATSKFKSPFAGYNDSKYPNRNAVVQLVALAYIYTGYKPLQLLDPKGNPFYHFDYNDVMEEYDEIKIPDLNLAVKPKHQNDIQVLDTLATDALPLLHEYFGVSDYRILLCSDPGPSMDMVKKYFFIEFPAAVPLLSSINRNTRYSGDLMLYPPMTSPPMTSPPTPARPFANVKDLFYMAIIMSQRHISTSYWKDECKLFWDTTTMNFKLYVPKMLTHLSHHAEAVAKNTAMIRLAIAGKLLGYEVMKMFEATSQSLLELEKELSLAIKLKAPRTASILPNCNIDQYTLDFFRDQNFPNYFQSIVGLYTAAITASNPMPTILEDLSVDVLKMLARIFIVNIPLPVTMHSSAGQYKLKADHTEVMNAFRDRLGSTYAVVNNSYHMRVQSLKELVQQSMKGLLALLSPAQVPIYKNIVQNSIDKWEYTDNAMGAVSKIICDGIHALSYNTEKEASLVLMALSMKDCLDQFKKPPIS